MFIICIKIPLNSLNSAALYGDKKKSWNKLELLYKQIKGIELIDYQIIRNTEKSRTR